MASREDAPALASATASHEAQQRGGGFAGKLIYEKMPSRSRGLGDVAASFAPLGPNVKKGAP